jgi:TonB family protein
MTAFAWLDDSDEEMPRRIRSSSEFAAALAVRRDIFFAEKYRLPTINESLCIGIGVGLAVWLQLHPAKVIIGPDAMEKGFLPSVVLVAPLQSVAIPRPAKDPSPPAIQPTAHSDRHSLSRRHGNPGRGIRNGGGDPRAHVYRRGFMKALSDSKIAGLIGSGDPLSNGGFANQIDAIIDGVRSLVPGSAEPGRKGLAGIGFGKGVNSGFGDGDGGSGIEGTIADLLTPGTTPIHLTKRTGPLEVGVPPILSGGALVGTRSYLSIKKIVMQNMLSIMYAYNRHLRTSPDLRGKVTVEFAISDRGDVISCIVRSSTLNDFALENEVIKIIQGWKFEKIDVPGDITVAVYPFSFSS